MDLLREKFLKVYVNVPLNFREQVIFVVEGKPITWNVAYLEIKSESPNSAVILNGLDKLNLI